MKTVRFLLLFVLAAAAYLAVVAFVVEPIMIDAFSAPETFELLPAFEEFGSLVGYTLGRIAIFALLAFIALWLWAIVSAVCELILDILSWTPTHRGPSPH